jgi:hypothetical protein
MNNAGLAQISAQVVRSQYIEDFFRDEHDADGRRSFVAVEQSMLDRLLGSEIYTESGWLVVGFLKAANS